MPVGVDPSIGGGWAARYWPTDALLLMSEKHGVLPSTVREDFHTVPPTTPPEVLEPLILEPLAPRGGAVRRTAAPESIPILDTDQKAGSIRADILAHNRLAEGTVVTGCLPPRWCRQFKETWDFYGRWHAAGLDGNYQLMSERDRLHAIKIAGEPVAEVDIGASHLTLLHGLLGLPVPAGDLYGSVSEFPRDVVKAWVTATIGKGSPVTRWAETERSLAVLDHDPKAVKDAVLTRFPFLASPASVVEHLSPIGPPKRLLIHRLMAIEAGIITTVMGFLRGPEHPDWPEPRVLSLPMHDGLIVPRSAVSTTLDHLWRAGAAQGRVRLRLKVSVAGVVPVYPDPPSDLRIGHR